VIGGRSAITSELAVRLEKGIGATAHRWLRLQAAYDLARVCARENEKEIVVRRLVPKVAEGARARLNFFGARPAGR
jgi:plasmid maintenance system antidote protein VapI